MPHKLPNIVLIVCDTLGAEHMSLYGYERSTTPRLERLVEEMGFTVYTNCYTTSCWTSPAHASLFTGLYPREHGVHEKNICLREDLLTLPELLKWSGYTTIGVSCNLLIDTLTGFGKGFRIFHSVGGRLIFQEADPHIKALGRFVSENSTTRWDRVKNSVKWCLRNGTVSPLVKKAVNKVYKMAVLSRRGVRKNATPYTRKALQIAKREINRAGSPCFLFINLMQTHHNYNPPLGFRYTWSPRLSSYKNEPQNFLNHYYKKPYPQNVLDYFKDLYDEEVLFLDSCLVKFVKEVLNEDTLVIITSDHGEHFGEGGHYGHILSLDDAVTRVPLMVRYPGGSHEVMNRIVQLNDLMATLTEIIDCPVPPPLSSVSLLSSEKREKAFMEIVWPERWLNKMKDGEFKRKVSTGPFQREVRSHPPESRHG